MTGAFDALPIRQNVRQSVNAASFSVRMNVRTNALVRPR